MILTQTVNKSNSKVNLNLNLNGDVLYRCLKEDLRYKKGYRVINEIINLEELVRTKISEDLNEMSVSLCAGGEIDKEFYCCKVNIKAEGNNLTLEVVDTFDYYDELGFVGKVVTIEDIVSVKNDLSGYIIKNAENYMYIVEFE